jgi:hypothetical protein
MFARVRSFLAGVFESREHWLQRMLQESQRTPDA